MRPIFCGNFEYDARPFELEKLFKRYGRVERVDMKSGFAFVYMEDERDAEDAIRGLDRIEFGRKGRKLRVEWTKQERVVRKPHGSRRPANMRPSKTLFVINFDPHHTRTRDLERHFDPYGKIVNVRIRKNFAFVQYDSEDDATRALDATNMSKLLDRVISVEFSEKDDDDKRNGYSPDRGHSRRRSQSPHRRERSSPDYGRGSSPCRRERDSPDYGRHRSPNSYRRERGSPDYGRGRSGSPHPRVRGERGTPNYGRHNSSSRPRERSVSDSGHGRSPTPRERDVVRGGDHGNKYGAHSPRRKEKASSEDGIVSARSPYHGERSSPENGELTMDGSPYARKNGSTGNGYGGSPSSSPEPRHSLNSGGLESPMEERYHSPSPPAEDDLGEVKTENVISCGGPC